MPKKRNSKRGTYEIFKRILKVASNGATRTRIMYMSNLSFDLLEKYTKTLMKRGLIGLDEADKGLYFTTERGRKFLDVFEELEKIVEPQKEERHNDHEILSLER